MITRFSNSLDHQGHIAGTSANMPRLKVLALHGFGTSGAIFKKQLQRAGLDESLTDLLDLHYLDGPIPVPEADCPAAVRRQFGGHPHFAWYTMRQVQAGKDFNPVGDPVLEHVLAYTQQHGPFAGMLAFSQGAMVAGLLLTLRRNKTSLQDDGLGSFTVNLAGGAYGAPYPDCLAPESLPEPSLHVLGDRDPFRKSSEELLGTYQNPLQLRHGGGHIVPPLAGEELATLRAFLQAQTLRSRL